MLCAEDLKKTYVKYIVYSVLRLKDKYGFKIKLFFDDGSEIIRQIGGFSRKKEANEERDNVIVALKNHTYVVYPKIKFNEYMDFWLESVMKPCITYNSYMSYRNIVRNYAIPFFGKIYLTQLNIGHIQNFYNYARSKYVSIFKLSKAVIKSAMQYAKDKNLIGINIAEKVDLTDYDEITEYKTIRINKNKVLSIDQIKILIEASKSTSIYLHILFAVLMGLRKQEINGLKYSDIDFINRKLYLNRQLGVDPKKSKKECSKKTYTKQEIKLKSYSSERILDIPDMVFDAIVYEKAKYDKNRRRRINDKTNPFFDGNYICCSTYGRPRSRGFIFNPYKKLLKDNNLPDITFHDLRHTFTTLLLMNNYSLKTISCLLGHASTIVTYDVYFDKSKIVIDCTDELNNYINKVVRPDEINDLTGDKLDTNLAAKKYAV